jgi:PAS domain S-box-containing protein
MLVLPVRGCDPALVLIDLDDGAGPDDREQSPVRHPDEPINAILKIQVLDKAKGNLTPDLHEPRQQVRSVETKFLARLQGNRDGFFRFAGALRKLGFRGSEHCLILAKVAQIASEQGKDARPVDAIDGPEEIIWRMNAETKEVVYVNRAYTAVTGHPIESLYRDPSSYRELIHPQDRIRVLSRLQEAVVSGRFDEEFQFLHANGTIRWIWVKASLAPENGNTRWLVGAAMDITSRKQAEQQISEHLDAAEAARAEAEALRKATLALSHNLSMDSVLDTLLECIGELVPFDKASILFMDDPDHMFVAREAPRTQPRGTICVLSCSGNHILQRILFEHKPALLSDTAKDPNWRDAEPFDRTRSWLGIPLIAAGRVIGVLSLSSHTPSVFSTEHLRLAKNLAVSAAVAIENARTHERAEIYAAELELRLEELREAQKALQQAAKEPSDNMPSY